MESRVANFQMLKQKLIESEEHFRTITEAVPLILWTATPEGISDYANPYWYDFTGADSQSNWLDVTHADDREKIMACWGHSIKTGEVYENEYRIRRKDGVYRWHLVRAQPIYSDSNTNGKIIKWFGTATDIHEQKILEQELAIAVQKYQSFISQSAEGMWRFEVAKPIQITLPAEEQIRLFFEQGFLDECNDAMARMYGFDSSREIIGKNLADLLIPNEQQNINLLKAFIEAGYRLSNAESIEVDRAGKIRYFLNNFVGTIENGCLVRAWGLQRDVTDQRQIEDEIAHAQHAAEMANKAKTAFLANMSHEIRTPLGVIRGFADLLESGTYSHNDHQEWVTTIRRNAYHLTAVIDELLDLSKIEAEKLEVEKIKFSLRDLIDDITSLLNFKAREKGIDLKIHTHGNFPERIWSDPTRLKQILVNTIGNAIKFTVSGRVEVRMEILEQKESSFLKVLIRDTGIGLSTEEQFRLFQPFMQADSSTTRKFGGTGLGLFISKRLAQALGGDLSLAQSDINRGSTFILTIDCGVLTSSDYQVVVDPKKNIRKSFKEPLLKGLKILVVEDAIDNQRLITRFLTLAGAEVICASNGKDGVEKAKEWEQDVILMDIQMPELDGYGATKKLREDGYGRPIIALTAHAMKEERELCLKSGFDDHLSKPINRESLIETLRKFQKSAAYPKNIPSITGQHAYH